MEKVYGEIFLGSATPVEDLGFEGRAKRPGIEKVKQMRIAYFMLVFLTLYLSVHKFCTAVSIKHALVDLDIYMRPEFMSPDEVAAMEVVAETAVEAELVIMTGDQGYFDKPTPGYQPRNQMEYEAMSERAGMQATIEFSILADIITATLFLITTVLSVFMSYNRTCGVKNAEFRGMAICTFACTAVAFSLIGGVVGATVYQDKQSELMSLPAFDNPQVLAGMGNMMWLEFGGGIMTCLSHITLCVIAVYYADDYSGDSLYLPVKQRPIQGLDFWEARH